MKVFLAVSLLVFALAGCASRDKQIETKPEGSLAENVEAAAGNTVTQTQEGFADAALAPLDDLNLRREPIPPLLEAMKNPYDLPADLSCEQISAMLVELDVVLGPDWDTFSPDERLNTEKLADQAADAALGAVKSSVTGWIPYRGLLREATGAAAHQRKYNQAYRIGAQRRSYLKGYGLALSCDPPARPNFEKLAGEADGNIVYK